MIMRFFIVCGLAFIVPLCSNAQKDSNHVSLKMNSYRPSTDSEFMLHIEFRALKSKDILLYETPFFSVVSSDFGNIRFQAEELVNGCFRPITIDHDPDPPDILNPRRLVTLKPNDTVKYNYDIRNSILMDKGVYRLRVHFIYSTASKKGITELSDWIYFEVPLNGLSAPAYKESDK